MTNKLDRNGYAPSLLTNKEACFWCGRMSGKLDRHEIYHGAYRDKSKRLGLWVTLCHDCHMTLHQRDASIDRALKNTAQVIAQQTYGWNTNDFRREFGKNYLNIEEDT